MTSIGTFISSLWGGGGNSAAPPLAATIANGLTQDTQAITFPPTVSSFPQTPDQSTDVNEIVQSIVAQNTSNAPTIQVRRSGGSGVTNLEPVESLLPDTLQQSTLQPSSGSGFDKYLKKQSAGLMYAINGTGIDHSIPEGISVLSNTRIKCSDAPTIADDANRIPGSFLCDIMRHGNTKCNETSQRIAENEALQMYGLPTIPIDKVTVMRNGTLNTYDTSIPEERNRLILETDLTDKGISQCHQASRHFNPKNPHKVVVMSTLDRTNQTAATVMGARDPLTGLPISDWAGGPRVAVWDVNGQLTLAYKRDAFCEGARCIRNDDFRDAMIIADTLQTKHDIHSMLLSGHGNFNSTLDGVLNANLEGHPDVVDENGYFDNCDIARVYLENKGIQPAETKERADRDAEIVSDLAYGVSLLKTYQDIRDSAASDPTIHEGLDAPSRFGMSTVGSAIAAC